MSLAEGIIQKVMNLNDVGHPSSALTWKEMETLSRRLSPYNVFISYFLVRYSGMETQTKMQLTKLMIYWMAWNRMILKCFH